MTTTTKPGTINATMIEMIPELDSAYATAPMAGARWYKPDEILDNGSPCFIPCDKPCQGRRNDYIWMPEVREKKRWLGIIGKKKKRGNERENTTDDNDDILLPGGYYHLRTREAYVRINALLLTHKKKRFLNVVWIPRSKMTKVEKDVLYLMKLRLGSLVPDDVHANRMNHFRGGMPNQHHGDLAQTSFYTVALASTLALGLSSS